MVDARFLAFVGVMAVLIVTPGPDTAITIRNTLRRGNRGAAMTALGVGAGSAVWALAAAVGAAGLLAASAAAFTVFKLAAGALLVALGLATILSARRAPASATPSRTRAGGPFLQGLLNNLLNPKAGAIFLTVFPQFVAPGDGWPRLVAMVAVYEVMVVGWLALYGPVLGAARSRLGPRLERAVSAATGAVLVVLGVRLALERR